MVKAIEKYLTYLNGLSMEIYGVPMSDDYLQSLREKYQKSEFEKK